jgi:hypothetical protein
MRIHNEHRKPHPDIDLSQLEYEEVNLLPGQWAPNATDALSDLTAR